MSDGGFIALSFYDSLVKSKDKKCIWFCNMCCLYRFFQVINLTRLVFVV